MTPQGPLYCETGHPWLFMAEPVNTVTNVFILISAIAAFLYVRRARIGMPLDLSVLLLLLLVTAFGSFAWHGFRTRMALAFDAIPGLLFLFVFAGLWIRALWGNWAGLLGSLALLGASAGSIWLSLPYLSGLTGVSRAMFITPAYIVIALLGLFLFFTTARRHGTGVANAGGIAVLCGIVAAFCRSIDMMACRAIPIGTHFIWHILLSLAAYLGIVMLTRLKLRARGT
jgi:ceramidase